MIIRVHNILSIIQYQVSTTVMDLVVVFALFVFMLALLCFCVATVFLVNKYLYKMSLFDITCMTCFKKTVNKFPS